jgi:hypothetical protein
MGEDMLTQSSQHIISKLLCWSEREFAGSDNQ